MDRCRAPWAALVALVVLASAGCLSESEPPPSHLVDGTRARVPAVRLDAPNPQISTSVEATRAETALTPAARECLRALPEYEAAAPVVVRTGVAGLSVTFRTASGRALVACDGDHVIRADATSWCGRAYGRLERGRLLDPRLDVADCSTPAGETIAFAWIVPSRATAYLAVRQDDYTEVYPTEGGLPVRATTATVAPDRSGATFEVSEHSASGATLRTSTIEVRVAG